MQARATPGVRHAACSEAVCGGMDLPPTWRSRVIWHTMHNDCSSIGPAQARARPLFSRETARTR
jgi:hypothetical protein